MAKNSTFIKLDDTTPDHPKVDGLSNAAFRAWIEAICYCSEYPHRWCRFRATG